MGKILSILIFALLFSVLSCNNSDKNSVPDNQFKYSDSVKIIGKKNFLSEFNPFYDDGEINVVIEIPSGTVEKWEVNKTTGEMEWLIDGNKRRIVSYMGYPGNYGFIPQTLLPVEEGGDGDPIDVIVLGPAIERGYVIKCKLIGFIKMTDNGEKDDKMIAVREGTPLYQINSIEQLDREFNGITYILQTWFTNYKGPGIVEISGFGEKDEAMVVLKKAMNSFIEYNK